MRFALAIALFAASTTTAIADDSDWTGGYLGLSLGYIDASDTWDSISNPGEPAVTPEGASFSAYTGYGVDLAGLVLGLEADMTIPDLNDNATCDVVLDCSFDVNFMTTLRGRAGLAFGPTLVYATAGGALGYIEANSNDPSGTSASKSLAGYVIGAGFEHQTGSLRYGVEYRHSDYGEVQVDLGTPVGDLNLETDEVRARIAIVFD
jgi:outer membrane immunogenic protein